MRELVYARGGAGSRHALVIKEMSKTAQIAKSVKIAEEAISPL